MTNFDISTYFSLFIDEIESNLHILDLELLILEKYPEKSATLKKIEKAIQSIVRTASLMGVKRLSEFTSLLQNRTRNLSVMAPNERMELLKNSIGIIKQIKEAIITETVDEMAWEDCLKPLRTIESDVHPPPQVKQTETEKDSNRAGEPSATHPTGDQEVIKRDLFIEISLDEQALMKNVRALLIHHNLKEAGDILSIFPTLEEIENNEAFSGVFCVELNTQLEEKDLFHLINQISDVKEVHLFYEKTPFLTRQAKLQTSSQSEEKRAPINEAEINLEGSQEAKRLEYEHDHPMIALYKGFEAFEWKLHALKESCDNKDYILETIPEAIEELISIYQSLKIQYESLSLFQLTKR